MTHWLIKDAGVAGDNAPASPAIDGPGSSWRKLPQQVQTKKRKPFIKSGNPNHDPKTGEFAGGQPKTDLYKKRNDARVAGNNAMADLQRQLRETKKDDSPTGDEASQYNSADGRPRWMQSPGQGGRDPVYRSQKPGTNGNQDTVFSKNINENPPTVVPVDPDGYYIW